MHKKYNYQSLLISFSLIFLVSNLAIAREHKNWIYGDNHLITLPIESSGVPRGAGMTIGCKGNQLSLAVVWGVQVKNIYPQSSNPEAAKIYTYFGSSPRWITGWTPVENGTATVPPNMQTSVGSAVDSMIFDLLGMKSTSKKNSEMFNWSKHDFLQKLFNHGDENRENAHLRLTTTSATNNPISLTFDLRGFNDMAVRHLKGRCI